MPQLSPPCFLIACSGRGHVTYDDVSESEQRELQDLVARYLAGQVGEGGEGSTCATPPAGCVAASSCWLWFCDFELLGRSNLDLDVQHLHLETECIHRWFCLQLPTNI